VEAICRGCGKFCGLRVTAASFAFTQNIPEFMKSGIRVTGFQPVRPARCANIAPWAFHLKLLEGCMMLVRGQLASASPFDGEVLR
jgi:hypothetical protein